MIASSIIARAMSLADLQNSQFITYQDQQNSLYEAYKDLYSEITKNDDDYYVTIASTVIQPTLTASLNPNEYLCSLPPDFYKLRAIEYQVGAFWVPMERMSMSNRLNPGSRPVYRFQGNNLWIVGWNFNGFNGQNSIRIHYYPPAIQPTFPDQPIIYGSAVTAVNLNNVSSPDFANIPAYNGNAMSPNRTYFYIQGGTDIWFENIDTQTSGKLATTGGAATGLEYYKGYLYFIQGGNIYSGAYAPGATSVTFAQITITGSPVVTNFNVFSNLIYHSTASVTAKCALAGGTATQIFAFPTTGYSIFGSSGYPVYLNAAGNLIVNSTNLGGTYSAVTTDGSNYVFVLDSGKNILCLTFSFSSGVPTILTTSNIQQDVGAMGDWASNTNPSLYSPNTPVIPIVGYENTRFTAISALPDSDFSYPLNSNECAEIMAYQCAIDFKRKQDQNHDNLTIRKQELFLRLQENMRRDDYKMERVNNAYSGRSGPMGQGYW